MHISSPPVPSSPVSRGRVLFADDMPDLRLIMQINLEHAGFVVAGKARDGESALELWHELRGTQIDAVLLDQRMPRMTGLEVAERILETAPSTRIILFSGHVDPMVEARAYELGLAGCIDNDQLMHVAFDFTRLLTDEFTETWAESVRARGLAMQVA